MNTLVLLSGGMDSATALALAKNQAKADAGAGVVEAVSFNYGQRHVRELLAAINLASFYNVTHHVLDLRGAVAAFAGSALTGNGEVPEGHYEDESMKKTVVPNRNMTMISLAVGIAINRNLDRVIYAAHAGDHAIYKDCRPEFYKALRVAINEGNQDAPVLYAPFIDRTKTEIASLGSQLGVPFEKTWSCYKGGTLHCGACGTCTERIEAFQLAGIPDPTEYEHNEEEEDPTEEQERNYNRDIANSLKR